MTPTSRSLLRWTPRILTILYAMFISIFAADVFEETLTFWQTVLALFIHLIPTWIVLITLALSWRWPWVGTVVFTTLALLYLWVGLRRDFQLSLFLLIAGPLILAAGLFLADWLKGRQKRRLLA